ncbi:MAG: capsular polysaccharide biosynthesis protein [Paracoccaceae bacterium]
MDDTGGAGNRPKRLGVYSFGMLSLASTRQILRLAGWQLCYAPLARRLDALGVWGRKPSGLRAMAKSAMHGQVLVSVEDAPLRSVLPGRKSPPLGLTIDPVGVHFDGQNPSTLETILQSDARLDDLALQTRAAGAIAFLQRAGLSKYNAHPRGAMPVPAPGYVLVVDQSHNDASVRCGGADAATFKAMLAAARREHPDKPIIIRSHPASTSKHRPGYFSAADCSGNCQIWQHPSNPWDMLEGAAAVYCVTSQIGFEAILAGHRPRIFGLPFYAGWGLSDDTQSTPRRSRALNRNQLFAGVMILNPIWHDPFAGALCSLERALAILEARARAHWVLPHGSPASGMRRWKRHSLRRFLNHPQYKEPAETGLARARDAGKPLAIWASRMPETLPDAAQNAGVRLVQVEDGFLRSIGLGAELVPAQSLVMDDVGIYFNPARPSRLEALIELAAGRDCARGAALRTQIVAAGLSKYNLTGHVELPPRDGRLRILVPGQVEDDASIRMGAVGIRTNESLLKAVRQAFPEAFVIYKPHPDVVAGLRIGKVENCGDLADMVVHKAAPATLFGQVDHVATITSLMGFEALMHGLPVTCFGAPFYAGWGLTDDRATPPARRIARPNLDQLAQAVLVDYPLYRDPVSGAPCPPEVLVERMVAGHGRQPWYLRILARAQRVLRI